MRALTIGETMVMFEAAGGRGLVNGEPFRLRIGGAESNFGVALTRLGVEVTWVSRLGDDALGAFVHDTLRAEGLDLSLVRREHAPTGVFVKWHEDGVNHVLYRRSGSAASAIAPGDVPDRALGGVGLVHLTGITTALSPSAREAVVGLAHRSRAAGITVTFDPNYRPALWESPACAADAAREVLPYADWVLCGLEEGRLLFDAETPGTLRATVREVGAGDLAARVGERGVLVWEDDRELEIPPSHVEGVVDEIGAGDGFAAGFAFGLLHGFGPSRCARAGNAVAARALRGTGDWETFPRLAEVYDELFG